MIIDELKINLEKIIENARFSTIAEDIFLHDPKMWKSWIHTKSIKGKGITVVLNNESVQFYYKFMDKIRQYCDERHLYFSEGFLDQKLCRLVDKFNNGKNNTNMIDRIHEFLNQFDQTNYHTYLIFLPVSHHDKEIDLGDFQIKKLTRKNLDQYTDENENLKEINDLYIKFLKRKNESDIVAIIKVESIEKDDAVQKAIQNLKKFIYAEKLFDLGSFISIRDKSYYTISESDLIFDKTAKSVLINNRNHHILTRIWPSLEFYQELESYRKILYKFIFKNNLTSLQSSILSSMYWLGEVDILRDTNEKKYLSYITGLEKITLGRYEGKKKKKFAENICALYNTPDQIKFYEEYYERRNQLIHDQNIRIFNEQVSTVLVILREILLEMIDHSEKYQSVEEFWNERYNVEL